MYNSLLLGVGFLSSSAFAAGGVFDYKQEGADWKDIHDTCGQGLQQSPINFHDFGMSVAPDLALGLSGYLDYTSGINMIDTGSTIKSDAIADGTFIKTFWDGSTATFKPLQFHFHAPSEHTVGGYQYDLEVHFVHLYEDGSLAGVIGVFFDRYKGGSASNDFLTQIISGSAPLTEAGAKRGVRLNTFLQGLDLTKFYSYEGSLTTPPCTEGVQWTVLQEVQTISESQLGYFNSLWQGNAAFAGGKGNYRETMPWNDRAVLTSVSEGFAGLPVYTGAIALAAASTISAFVATSLLFVQ